MTGRTCAVERFLADRSQPSATTIRQQDVVPLTEAANSALTGAKAAALARALHAGLPVLPGFVLTPNAAVALSRQGAADLLRVVREAWADLTQRGARSVVVRSSSTIEDGDESSMAGRFTSLLDVRGWDSFLDAVAEVVSSGADVHESGDAGGAMAVLVQPYLQPEAGGVMFGADPVSGRRDRYVIAAVPGGPHELVSGEVDGVSVTLTTRGRVVESTGTLPAVAANVRALVGLQKRTSAVFGGPQDIEWAILEGSVLLLQSRPITTTGQHKPATGPILGPGPVAETFPGPVSPLEHDLWVVPMIEAIREVLSITGAQSTKALARSPVIVSVDGRVAADLELLGVERPVGRARSLWARLDPRRPLRRLSVAWSTGRLTAALPGLARDVIETVDDLLAEVPPVEGLSDYELVGLLDGSREALRSAYGYEMLASRLLDVESAPTSAALHALRVLAADRDRDTTVDELVARHPVLLALVPPSIGAPIELPSRPLSVPPARDVDATQLLREALRLRARWLQELTARAAVELGKRLERAGRITSAAAVRGLAYDTLLEVVRGEIAIAEAQPELADGGPLPVRFRLTATGNVVAVRGSGEATSHAGRGAGGGRASGVVASPDRLPAEDAVLVVQTLNPALAPILPGLRALVAETGSVLSHLAILAREAGVPTVVGVADAVNRFPLGTEIVVDGSTGEVSLIAGEEAAA